MNQEVVQWSFNLEPTTTAGNETQPSAPGETPSPLAPG
jgi:hypothetical protein